MMADNAWYIVECRYFHGYGGSEEVYQIKDSPILEFECTEQEVAHITEAMNNEISLKAGRKYYYFDRKMEQPEQQWWINGKGIGDDSDSFTMQPRRGD